MAAPTKLVTDKDPRLLAVKKGEQVRLLLPLWDNVQYIPADTVIHWPFDHAPTVDQACLVSEPAAALKAPPMTDGKPPADYIDPVTNKPLPPPPSV
jgi:hypothetical protein